MAQSDGRQSDGPPKPLIMQHDLVFEPLIINQPDGGLFALIERGQRAVARISGIDAVRLGLRPPAHSREGGHPGFRPLACPILPACVVYWPSPSFEREQEIADTGTGA